MPSSLHYLGPCSRSRDKGTSKSSWKMEFKDSFILMQKVLRSMHSFCIMHIYFHGLFKDPPSYRESTSCSGRLGTGEGAAEGRNDVSAAVLMAASGRTTLLLSSYPPVFPVTLADFSTLVCYTARGLFGIISTLKKKGTSKLHLAVMVSFQHHLAFSS